MQTHDFLKQKAHWINKIDERDIKVGGPARSILAALTFDAMFTPVNPYPANPPTDLLAELPDIMVKDLGFIIDLRISQVHGLAVYFAAVLNLNGIIYDINSNLYHGSTRIPVYNTLFDAKVYNFNIGIGYIEFDIRYIPKDKFIMDSSDIFHAPPSENTTKITEKKVV